MKTKETTRSALITAIYLLLAFLSAFELFLIQPLMAKHILPWFGGAASVWTACLLFFQSLLFIGYLYAYFVSLLKLRSQIVIHVALLCLSFGMLVWQQIAWGNPALMPGDLALGGMLERGPLLAVVTLLALAVGLPYITLASTSPLVQTWFYGEHRNRKPLYFFYAVSNIGSLLALLAYPFVLEPLLRLRHQALAWGAGYAAFTLVCIICSLHALKTSEGVNHTLAENTRNKRQRTSMPPARLGLLWLGLSACASLMLIAMTNQICANVAPVPLLWLLPLSLYLVAFIVCFSSRAASVPTVAALVMLPATALVLFVMKHALALGILPQLATYLAALFCSCMLCLGILHRERPSPEHLTFFYLMVALGGALGGILVGVVAPLIFVDYWELRIGLLLSCATATWVLLSKPWISAWRIPLLVASLVVMASLARMSHNPNAETVAKSRNFYGGLKVLLEQQTHGTRVYSMMHGRICHGLQFDRGQNSRQPSTYFGADSGIGIAMKHHPKRVGSETGSPSPLHVGVLGLGIGTIAAYGEAGDRFRFYEINPDVVTMATNTAFFRYLSSCPATVDIVMGDARLSLEEELRERGSQGFDILTLDVFNGDAIPAHLLTVEAFSTYLAHLNPETGVLALHVTNMYLDLVPIVARIANHYGLHGCIVKGVGDLRLTSDSLWVLLAHDQAFMPSALARSSASPLDTANTDTPLWTDDFSDVLSIMKKTLFVKAKPTLTKSQ
jgi:hypothetical protein